MDIHPERDLASARAREFAVDLDDLHATLKSEIAEAQQRYQRSADKNRLPPPDFQVGQKVYVKAKYFHTTRPSKKLSEKYFGPFEIIAKPGQVSFTLRFPDSMRLVHPIFHVSMLEDAPVSSIPNRTNEPPPPVEIDSDLEYEIAEVLEVKIGHQCQCKF